jgi:hypothetical protein
MKTLMLEYQREFSRGIDTPAAHQRCSVAQCDYARDITPGLNMRHFSYGRNDQEANNRRI